MIFLTIIFIFLLQPFAFADIIIGGENVYRVEKGDSIELISAKLGVNKKILMRDNKINIKKHLTIGQEIRANTRKIVPQIADKDIIINIPDRMLYFFKEETLAEAFPVGLGMPSWRGITRWRTPIGTFKIIGKRKNPTWHLPESMKWKMMMEGKPIKTSVPPGPGNPLGRYALDTSIARVVIHETIWPTSVYKFRSHGCVRVLPQNMEKFYRDVEINTHGEIIYKPVKIAVREDGRIFLEVHHDIYGKIKDLNAETRRIIEEKGATNKINWEKVKAMIREKTGIAEDITR
jgi:L,D-transpeptidase ErfK/SrfK